MYKLVECLNLPSVIMNGVTEGGERANANSPCIVWTFGLVCCHGRARRSGSEPGEHSESSVAVSCGLK